MTDEQKKQLEELDTQLNQLQEERQGLMKELGLPALGPGPRTSDEITMVEEEGLIPTTDEITTVSTDEEGNITTSEIGTDDLLKAIQMFGRGGRR